MGFWCRPRSPRPPGGIGSLLWVFARLLAKLYDNRGLQHAQNMVFPGELQNHRHSVARMRTAHTTGPVLSRCYEDTGIIIKAMTTRCPLLLPDCSWYFHQILRSFYPSEFACNALIAQTLPRNTPGYSRQKTMTLRWRHCGRDGVSNH